MGSQFGEFGDDILNGFSSADNNASPAYDETLNYANLFNYKDPSQDLSSLNLPTPPFDPPIALDSIDDGDSDGVLKFISQMLMEENMEEQPCMFHTLALQAAEKPFYDALGKNYPPHFNQHYLDSPEGNSLGSTSDFSEGRCWSNSTNSTEPILISDASDNTLPIVQTPSIDSYSQPSNLPQWSFGSSGTQDSPVSSSWMMSPLGGMNIFSDKESMIQFQKGVEEASKFLPKNSNLIVDLDDLTFPNELEDDHDPVMVVKEEKDENPSDNFRGSKVHYLEDEDLEEGRSTKQSAISTEEVELSDMFDKVLLCMPGHCSMAPNPEKGLPSQIGQLQGEDNNNTNNKKDRPKKQDNLDNVVDLRSLLVLCAQSAASDDRRTADKVLKQIREHSFAEGDGSQRLAHYFANALEARLAGSGSQIYTALSSKRPTAADMIKAYQFYMHASPFKKISMGCANQMILKAAEKASKLHIIDFGILYGFQWPNFIQCLSERPGGPPELCITGIDLPQPGFRPAERVEATGRRLANYCKRFNVPFKYHAIAQKWETIKPEDLKIEGDEVVVVNSQFRFKNLLDETIVVDSPRNAVLRLIRRIKPDIFVHGVVNGSYNAPFFVTRFKEALFHFSALFDMFDVNTSREEPERLMFEKEFFGREIMNVVACEGTERVERPEAYKQWQARNTKAGFKQLGLDLELIQKLRSKVRAHYHKDFVIDVDGNWALEGWKGRITYAISAWVPA